MSLLAMFTRIIQNVTLYSRDARRYDYDLAEYARATLGRPVLDQDGKQIGVVTKTTVADGRVVAELRMTA